MNVREAEPRTLNQVKNQNNDVQVELKAKPSLLAKKFRPGEEIGVAKNNIEEEA